MKRTLLALLALGLLNTAVADVVYVTSLTSNCTSTTICGNGPNPDININYLPVYTEDFSAAGAYTSARATTPDKPVTPGARYFSNSFSNTAPALWIEGLPPGGISISPTLGVTGGVYKVYHVYSSTAGNVSTNIIMGVTNTSGCTLSFTETDKFQRKFGTPAPQQWQLLGILTNAPDTSTPTINFYYKDGLVNAGAQARLLVDTFRFTLYEPCTDVPPVGGITGPVATNVPNVTVTGVQSNATAVAVYQNSGSGMVKIGQLTSGVVAGNNAVPVTGLVKGALVAATQTIGGQEGCTPTAGFSVGGGINPSVRVALNVRENTALTGPVGAAGSGSIIHMLGTTSRYPGDAPEQGIVLQPSTNWQTVSFTNTVDPFSTWAGTDASAGTWDGPFGGLDGIAFACEGDTGPFEIYIDDLGNGTNGVFQDWEAASVGANAYGFSQPSFSGSTGGNLFSAPNVSQVTSAAAYRGLQSCRISFQFNKDTKDKWLRLVTSGASPVANPQLDVNEPVSFKVLLLPPGASPISPVPPPISIRQSGATVTLNWTGSYQLQSAPTVTGGWNDVDGVKTGPHTENLGTEKYFRLRNPVNN